jgi:hypothetical protein
MYSIDETFQKKGIEIAPMTRDDEANPGVQCAGVEAAIGRELVSELTRECGWNAGTHDFSGEFALTNASQVAKEVWGEAGRSGDYRRIQENAQKNCLRPARTDGHFAWLVTDLKKLCSRPAILGKNDITHSGL